MPYLYVIAGSISLLVWIYFWLDRGKFWKTDQQLVSRPQSDLTQDIWPSVCVIIAARNEAKMLPQTLPTILCQDYRGPFHVFLVDDDSDDNTSAVALSIAKEFGIKERLTVITAEPLTAGWTGKLWALAQGVEASNCTNSHFLLFTDADIAYQPDDLQRLVSKAQEDHLDMVSLMVRLQANTFWERFLIPAFVYFFAMIYPFRWVNNPQNKVAAAAGGCILLRKASLSNAGGLLSIATELIDDCALARLIKNRNGAEGDKIWLGLTQSVRSLRPYNCLADIWRMVCRTAFVQLNYSLLFLLGTVLAMLLVFVSPALSALWGICQVVRHPDGALWWFIALNGGACWLMMGRTYAPTLQWYGISPLYAPFLPIIACFYTLMTLDSARRFWQGRGGKWKDRSYSF